MKIREIGVLASSVHLIEWHTVVDRWGTGEVEAVTVSDSEPAPGAPGVTMNESYKVAGIDVHKSMLATDGRRRRIPVRAAEVRNLG